MEMTGVTAGQSESFARFLQEAKDLEGRWKNSGLLDGVSNNHQTAVMLECQRLHNETGTWDCCDMCRDREKVSKKVFKKKASKNKQWWLQTLRKKWQ